MNNGRSFADMLKIYIHYGDDRLLSQAIYGVEGHILKLLRRGEEAGEKVSLHMCPELFEVLAQRFSQLWPFDSEGRNVENERRRKMTREQVLLLGDREVPVELL